VAPFIIAGEYKKALSRLRNIIEQEKENFITEIIGSNKNIDN
jgi:hypothetical protein